MSADDKHAVVVTPGNGAMATSAPMDFGAMAMAAIERGAEGVEVLERIFALQTQWETKQQRAEFAGALARAQGAIGTVPHDMRGDKSTYASLEQIAAHSRAPLADNGLSYWFTSESVSDPWTVTFHLQHASGHVEPTTVRAPKGPTKIKRRDGGVMEVSERDILSGALKTGRRLAMSLGLGLVTGEAEAPAEPAPSGFIDAEQREALEALIISTKTKLTGFLRFAGAEHLETIRASRYEECLLMLDEKAARQAKEIAQ